MKRITFTNPTAQKIYDDYLKRVGRCISILSENDRQEMLMEINSHIYEATHTATAEAEIDTLMDTLEKLGAPEEVLQPVVAQKKVQQATRTFNPKHIAQALYLNIFNGVGYFILAVIYMFIFACGALIVLKLIYPSHTGLFVGDGHFFAGYSTYAQPGNELLGNWFIITVILVMGLLYFLNTLLFRLLKRK